MASIPVSHHCWFTVILIVQAGAESPISLIRAHVVENPVLQLIPRRL